MHWLGFTGIGTRPVLDLMYLGLKHFRVPRETSRIRPTVFSDDELRAVRVPTLLLIGDHEVISDPAKALARAKSRAANTTTPPRVRSVSATIRAS